MGFLDICDWDLCALGQSLRWFSNHLFFHPDLYFSRSHCVSLVTVEIKEKSSTPE